MQATLAWASRSWSRSITIFRAIRESNKKAMVIHPPTSRVDNDEVDNDDDLGSDEDGDEGESDHTQVFPCYNNPFTELEVYGISIVLFLSGLFIVLCHGVIMSQSHISAIPPFRSLTEVVRSRCHIARLMAAFWTHINRRHLIQLSGLHFSCSRV